MENTFLRRAVLYIRVATESQFDNSAMENQSARLHQQAERERIEVVGEVRANERGTTLDRPGWREAMRLAAEKQADTIFVTDLDRVVRGTEEYYRLLSELDKHGIRLYTCYGELNRMPELEQLFSQYAAQAR